MSVVQIFRAEDGTEFNTRAEAVDHNRRPKILEALSEVTEGNAELNQWLLDNQEQFEMAFEIGAIRRVSKGERKKLDKALEFINTMDNKEVEFIKEHTEAIRASFRHLAVKRMTPEERTLAAKNTFVAALEGNVEVAEWIIENREAIEKAFKAGRPVNPGLEKGGQALAAYHAARKAAAEKAVQEQAQA